MKIIYLQLSQKYVYVFMKTTITIFVSGSKSLKEHRLRLKALVNNLNGENRLKGSPITLNMFSYTNLGDSQFEYDDFIRNKTDIVFFILDGRIGDKTRDEFLLASKAYKENGTPKIYVFLKEFAERTPDIEAVEKLLRDNYDSYYIDYSNLEDLEFKVKERLVHEMNLLEEKTLISPKKKLLPLRIWAWTVTVCSILLFTFLYSYVNSFKKESTLLFIGGGSAVRCLETEYKDVGNVYQYDNSICIAVPTSTSWPIIASEVMQHHAINGGEGTKLFYPVCLSAMEADESSFLKMSSRNEFVSKGSVLSYHIGDDYLVLYVKNGYKNKLIDDKEQISAREFAAFLKDISKRNVMVYTTEEGSGTLTYYQKTLEPYNINISKTTFGDHLDKFTDLTPMSKIRRDETPYIMLGSRYYVSQETYDNGDCRAIKVMDDKGQLITKSIFLYFAGYNEDDGTSFWIPNEMVTLLEKMDSRFQDIIHNNRLKRVNERVVVSVNDYLGNKEQNNTAIYGTENHHDWVDLGVSVKWATCNVGASTPSDYGNFFAWGETSNKISYSWTTYKHCKGSYETITKYCDDINYGNNGFTDGISKLEPIDDVAHVKWSGSWRMPTAAEFQELMDNCSWAWTTLNGVNGYAVTGTKPGYTDNTIFLPAAGFCSNSETKNVGTSGGYWTSSHGSDYPGSAVYFSFVSDGKGLNNGTRSYGDCVRPVCP